MILFVGDRPSKRTDPNVPFKGAACETRLMEWIVAVIPGDCTKIRIINQCDYEDYELTYLCSHSEAVITLGANASKLLEILHCPHFKLPHPSGRNRQINDKAFIASKLEECRNWLKSNQTPLGAS